MPRPEKSDMDPIPTEKYIRRLQELCERFGISYKDVGMSAMTQSRLFNLEQPTLAAANRYAQVLRDRGVEMPPAHVSILDDIDHEWIVRGRELREAAPDRFNEILEILQEFARAARSTLEAEGRLHNLVGTLNTKSDKVPDGGGVK